MKRMSSSTLEVACSLSPSFLFFCVCVFFFIILFQTLNVSLDGSSRPPQLPGAPELCGRGKQKPIKGDPLPFPLSENTAATIKRLLKQSTFIHTHIVTPAHNYRAVSLRADSLGKTQTSGSYFLTHLEKMKRSQFGC